MVTVKMEGYDTKHFEMDQKFAAIGYLNIFNLGFGCGIDFLSGKIFKYSETSYKIDLDKSK